MPDFVATFTTPPEARPYSAEKLLVTMLYSCTASIGMFSPIATLKMAMFSTPSSRISVPDSRWPFTEKPTPLFESSWPPPPDDIVAPFDVVSPLLTLPEIATKS